MTWRELGDWTEAGTATGWRMALSRQGMVSTPHESATQIAIEVLATGGNAVDAAIAASAALCVLSPHQCSIGGDAFWLLSLASGEMVAVNASGRSAADSDVDGMRSMGLDRMPERGGATVTVPGLVDSWYELHRRFATRPLEQLLDPAVRWAEHGFVASPYYRRQLLAVLPELSSYPETTRVFMPSGRVPAVGEVVRQVELAGVLGAIARDPRVFYEGELADRIAQCVREYGGWLTRTDMAEHHSEFVSPVSAFYRDIEVVSLPPNSQAIAGLIALAALDRLPDEPSLSQQIAAKRLAFDIRDRYITDPEFMLISGDELLKPTSIRDIASAIGDGSPPDVLSVPPIPGGTTHFGVIDENGNGVSAIQSTFGDFGSGITVPGTGIVLQNRGASFSLSPDHCNVLSGSKRTLHTLMPSVFRHRGELAGVIGAMGGDGQAQTLIQLVIALVSHGIDPATAVASPRWLDGAGGAASGEVLFEGRFRAADVSSVERAGYATRLVERFDQRMGHAQVILREPASGVLYGAADPRSDGLALGIAP